MTTRHASLWLLLSAMLSGCVGETYRRGMESVDVGDFVEATEGWLDDLEQDQFEPGALKGLERWGDAAHDQLLDQAREHEAQRRWEQALETYDKLIALDEELAGVAALDFGPHPEVKTERKDVEDAWARALLESGARNLAGEKWGDAVADYEKALALRPGLKDARKPLADAYLGWGHEAREANQYRDAVDRFDAAMAFGAGRAARLWSAAVHVALGEHFYEERHCRAAARELRKAGDYLDDLEIAEKLALAEDCARVELVIQPFESLPELTVSGTAPGAMLADRLEAVLRDQSTEFVFLLDPLATTTQEALGGGLAGQRPGTLFEVRGRITQLAVERHAATDTEQTLTGTTHVLCPLPEGVYYRSEEWCDEPVAVTVAEHMERISAQGTGSVRVVMPRNGEQVLTEPIQARLQHERAQVKSVTRTEEGETVKAKVAAEPAEGVVAIPQEVLDRMAPPPPLPTESQLALDLTNALAESAAAAILAVVDHTPEVVDPVRLTIPDPVLSAEDVKFHSGGDIQEEPVAPPPPPEPEATPDGAAPAPVRAVIPKGPPPEGEDAPQP